MRFHKYTNMEEYRSIQTEWNKKKIGMVWVSQKTLELVAEKIKERLPEAKFGICHGTRRGVEQEKLRGLLGIEVIGTEISDTATQFPNTIQWDFHNVKEEWIGAVDFIYSNSLDHSHSPREAMAQWMRCLKVGGICFIDWDDSDHGESHVNSLDCFGASLDEMRRFLIPFGDVQETGVGDGRKGHILFSVVNI